MQIPEINLDSDLGLGAYPYCVSSPKGRANVEEGARERVMFALKYFPRTAPVSAIGATPTEAVIHAYNEWKASHPRTAALPDLPADGVRWTVGKRNHGRIVTPWDTDGNSFLIWQIARPDFSGPVAYWVRWWLRSPKCADPPSNPPEAWLVLADYLRDQNGGELPVQRAKGLRPWRKIAQQIEALREGYGPASELADQIWRIAYPPEAS